MRKLSWMLLASALGAGSVMFTSGVAHAGLSACGNIDVSADAMCTLVTSGGCETQCTPLSFQAACNAKFEVSCEGMCSGSISADCTATCQGKCSADCTANPGTLDCGAECNADCTGNCSAKCASDSNSAECQASCKSCCGGRCDAKCTGTPPSATCDAKCSASCQGSCSAQANFSCQESCQAMTSASCEATFMGGCMTQCQTPQGALFCDGNFVDTGDNLQNCLDAINNILKIKVTASASGEAGCDGGTCEASGQASASVSACSASPGDASLNGGVLLVGAGIGIVAFGARRRRRAS